MKKIENKKLALEELQRAFDKTISAMDILDNKLQNVLNYSSIILTIFTAITTSALLDKVGCFYWIGLSIISVLYIVNYFYIKSGLEVATYHNPISGEGSELKKKVIDVKGDASIDILIEAYIFCIYDSSGINSKKGNVFSVSSNLMSLSVILMMVTVILGLTFPDLKLSDILEYVMLIL